MNKLLKILLWIVGGLAGLCLLVVIGGYAYFATQSSLHHSKLGDAAPTLTDAGHSYRDLNKNGQLDPYEDHRNSIDQRVEDLLGQMTLEEKAGMMFINMILMNETGEVMDIPDPSNPFSFFLEANSSMIAGKQMNHFNVLFAKNGPGLAKWGNTIQGLAERTRLGIPITIASDPRHSYSDNIGAALMTPFFSQWPEPIGLAATRDTNLVREFGDIARREYRAVGIHLALHPMADLATEPRWARINGTFGEDAHLSAEMTKAYVLGMQGDSLTETSVACMTKHFSGGGPQMDGEDAHFPYGREQVYPGDQFDYHLIPFEEGAFPAKTAQIMPYYGIPMGQTSEDVAFAFNKEIITRLLREAYQFDGVICTDWGLVTNSFAGEARAWGVEHLSEIERVEKIIQAGCDQFGGESRPELIIELVESGRISEARIDQSIRRLLRDKFRLGLFDQPYVDVDQVEQLTGTHDYRAAGALAQRKSLVLLKNDTLTETPVLPLESSAKVYLDGFKSEVASKFATVVSTIEEADYVLMRLNAPFQPRNGSLLESFFHQGDLDFKSPEKERILSIVEQKPTIISLYMDRPAVMPEIAAASAGLIVNFGADDEAILDVVFGAFNPTGKLPIEIPSSLQAVELQKEDVPYDSENPLFKFGHGLSYGGEPDTAMLATDE
ncbi:glycoside hydrolase family 3 N-terminal domain-containing protein [Pontibacter sp. G13]|uniref:glycoside hydrolase family 3 protein n=1 Tax=Pontibacter sp. G13 TaxID=3074898 RepID=UPI00288B1DB8|nr:glycoside hydrolase family 3 N-terminal domain-containing protein [Pontibacter sp. G13]WNJ20233.1 glycoside hydrolase family 3 N-terminal domain-containing protein [Pontibacter sp. G13]